MASTIPVIVQGNSFSLAIPLQIYYINGDQMDLEDYTPDPTDEVSVQLKGSRRNYTYTPTIDGNVANIDLTGNELADNYGVVVSVVKANGQRLRSFRTDQFFIVESSDDLTPSDIIEGLEENVIYLNSSIFVAGEDGRGITSIVKTSTAGLVDTYTITYSDNTTSTFTVTNGAQGEAGVSIASVTTPTPVNGTAIITLSNGDTITLDLMHSHENMAKLVVVDDESELPSTMDESTIYAVKGTTEITKLFVGSLPFSPSPAPTPTYEDLTAVKLTGTQWLLTDYYPNANTEFEMVLKFTANENTQNASLQGWCFLRCDNPTSNNKFTLYNGLAGTSGSSIYGAYQIFIALDSHSSSIDMKTNRVEFEADQATLNYVIGTTNGTLTFNGGSIRSTTLVKKEATQLTPIQIGNDASKGDNGIYKSFDLTIYRFTITENGNTVRNWLPKSLNGVAGLYDTINDTFITSQTDTPLVAIP